MNFEGEQMLHCRYVNKITIHNYTTINIVENTVKC